MSQESAMLNQRAVLWDVIGIDDYGRPLVGPPVQISVRWEQSNRQTFDDRGNPVGINVTAVVDHDITTGSRLWLGSLSELPEDGSNPDDVMEVVSFQKIPDVKQREFYRAVTLIRLGR